MDSSKNRPKVSITKTDAKDVKTNIVSEDEPNQVTTIVRVTKTEVRRNEAEEE